MSSNINTTYAPPGATVGGFVSTAGFNGISNTPYTSIADAKIHIDGGVNGSMRVNVPLLVNGRDVMRELDELRDAMLLLKRDVDMESKYPKLKELKEAYEAQLEKYKTFEALK